MTALSRTLSTRSAKREVLEHHNFLRKSHIAPPLEWSEECHHAAQLQADVCAREGRIVRGNTEGASGPHGQNIYGRKGKRASIEKAIDAWYDDGVEVYDFTAPGPTEDTLEFSQLVWSATTHVGMAISEDRTYVVANYWPAGNQEGEFESNVFEEVVLEKAAELIADADVERIGMTFSSWPPKALIVKRVDKGSWAEEMHVEVGDMFMEVNGTPVHEMDVEMFKTCMLGRPLTLKLPDPGQHAAVLKMQTIFRGRLAKEELCQRKKARDRDLRMKAKGLPTRYKVQMAIYEKLDRSQDGFLNADEIGRLVRLLGILDPDDDFSHFYFDICEAYDIDPDDGLNTGHFIKLMNNKDDDWYQSDDQLAEMLETLEFEASLIPRPGRRGDVGRGLLTLTCPLGTKKTGMHMTVPPSPIHVNTVHAGMWAEGVGIEPGDTFTEINGIPAYMLSPAEFRVQVTKRPLLLTLAAEEQIGVAIKLQTVLRIKKARKELAAKREERSKLVKDVFEVLDKNGDSLLQMQEMFVLVRNLDLYDSEEGWLEDFPGISEAYGWKHEGLALEEFSTAINVSGEDLFCTNDQLKILHDKLTALQLQEAADAAKREAAAVTIQAVNRGKRGRQDAAVKRQVAEELQRREAAAVKIQAHARRKKAKAEVAEKREEARAAQEKRHVDLISSLFLRLDVNQNGWLSREELFTFVTYLELVDDFAQWTAVFPQVEKQYCSNVLTGIDLVAFTRLVEDEDGNFQCSDEEMQYVLKDLADHEDEEAEALRLQQEELTRIAAEEAELSKIQNAAAVRIQSAERGRVARNAIAVQREEQQLASENAAALRIQSAERGRLARNAVAVRREEQKLAESQNAAALRIQSAERGRLARNAVAVRREEQKLAESQNAAALRIQSAERGRIARKHVAAQKVLVQGQETATEQDAEEMVESEEPEEGVDEEAAAEEAAALRIQSVHRGRVARKDAAARRLLDKEQNKFAGAAIRIQSAHRGKNARIYVAALREKREADREELQERGRLWAFAPLRMQSMVPQWDEEERIEALAAADARADLRKQSVVAQFDPEEFVERVAAREAAAEAAEAEATQQREASVINRISTWWQGGGEELLDEEEEEVAAEPQDEVQAESSGFASESADEDVSAANVATEPGDQNEPSQKAAPEPEDEDDSAGIVAAEPEDEDESLGKVATEPEHEDVEEFAGKVATEIADEAHNIDAIDGGVSVKTKPEDEPEDKSISSTTPETKPKSSLKSSPKTSISQRASVARRSMGSSPVPSPERGRQSQVESASSMGSQERGRQNSRDEIERRESSATRIQSAERGRIVRKEIKRLSSAATRIQSRERGRKVRMKMSKKKDPMDLELPAVDISAERRDALLKDIFVKLDADKDGMLFFQEIWHYAEPIGYGGSITEFEGEYEELCADCERDPACGIDEESFHALANDNESDYYCPDGRLEDILALLCRKHNAASRIQSTYRGNATRKDVTGPAIRSKFAQRVNQVRKEEAQRRALLDTKFAEQVNAVIKLQSAQRGRQVRNGVGRRQGQDLEQEELARRTSEAAISIQSAQHSQQSMKESASLEPKSEQCQDQGQKQVMSVSDESKSEEWPKKEGPRLDLTQALFGLHDDNKSGRLRQHAVLALARVLAFPGSAGDWALVYSGMCSDHGWDAEIGLDVDALYDLLSDSSDSTWYCTVEQIGLAVEASAAVRLQSFGRARKERKAVQEDVKALHAQLVARIFMELDLDKDGCLNEMEMYHFVRLLDFPGDLNEFTVVYDEMHEEYGWDTDKGIDLETFRSLVENRDDSWYQSEEKLYYLLDRLLIHRAALKVQSSFRGLVARRQVEELRLNRAALTIQSAQRGSIGRRQAEGLANKKAAVSQRVRWRPARQVEPEGRVKWRCREGPVLQQMTMLLKEKTSMPRDGKSEASKEKLQSSPSHGLGSMEGPEPGLEKQMGLHSGASKDTLQQPENKVGQLQADAALPPQPVPYKRIAWRRHGPETVNLMDKVSKPSGSVTGSEPPVVPAAGRVQWRHRGPEQQALEQESPSAAPAVGRIKWRQPESVQ